MRTNNKPNSKKTATKSRKGSKAKASNSTDNRSPYQLKADELIFILFDDEDAPDFVRDVVHSFITELENQTNVLWNSRAVLQTAIPLMLKEVAPNPKDLELLFKRDSPVALSAYHDSLDTNDDEGRYPLTAQGKLRAEDEEEETDQTQRELEEDAAALARLIHSPHTPPEFRARLLEAMDEVRLADDAPEVIKVAYPLAVLKGKFQKLERSASDVKD